MTSVVNRYNISSHFDDGETSFDDANSSLTEHSDNEAYDKIIEIPSLYDKCLAALMKDGYLKTIDDVAAITIKITDISTNEKYQKLWERIQVFLKDRGSMLLESYEQSDLVQCFGSELIQSLIRIQQIRIIGEKKIAGYRTGKAIERQSLVTVTPPIPR